MKVHPDILVYSGRQHALQGLKDLLGDLKVGSELSARVLERTSPTRARIEIAGRRMEADFPKGVPGSSDLNLRLEGTKGGTVFFAISGRPSGHDDLGRLASFTVFARDEMDLRLLRGIADHVRSGIRGIYAFNSLLLPRGPGGRDKRSVPHDLLNALLRAGVKKEDAVIFSYIFSANRGTNLSYFSPLLTFLSGQGKKGGSMQYREPLKDEGEYISAVEHLIERLDSALDEKKEEGKRLFDQVVKELLPDGFVDSAGTREDFIAYLHDKEFQSCRYIINEKNILIELDLTLIGRVEALIREEGKAVQISLFCSNAEAADSLKRDARDLEKAIRESTGKSATAAVYGTGDAVKNVIEIYSSLMLNNAFDARA
jgi:hypothetical protein